MQIGIFGYGRMGKAVEKIARSQNIEIAWMITQANRNTVDIDMLRQADIVIEFTQPEAAYENVMTCLKAGIPVVSGTTGWQEQLLDAEVWCRENKGALLWASNFSVGVNLLFALNQYMARLMNDRPEYQVAITETHHVHKLDAPSGTALSLTKDILAQSDRKTNWVLSPTPPGEQDIPITAIRENEVPGTHTVHWKGPIDDITLEHRANSREGFASGAVLAAKWLKGKKGVFRMADVLGLNTHAS